MTSPRPWSIDQHDDTGELVVRDGEGRIVAAVEHWNALMNIDQLSEDEVEANAELIARAPKLQALARSFIDTIDEASDGADLDRLYERMTEFRDDLKRLIPEEGS